MCLSLCPQHHCLCLSHHGRADPGHCPAAPSPGTTQSQELSPERKRRKRRTRTLPRVMTWPTPTTCVMRTITHPWTGGRAVREPAGRGGVGHLAPSQSRPVWHCRGFRLHISAMCSSCCSWPGRAGRRWEQCPCGVEMRGFWGQRAQNFGEAFSSCLTWGSLPYPTDVQSCCTMSSPCPAMSNQVQPMSCHV